MIVECPSCLTKFSIDSQQIADIEDPRFNCCRCGSYFELQQIPAEAIEPIHRSTDAGDTNAEDEEQEEPEDEWTISSEAEEQAEAASSQSGSWMLNETMSLSAEGSAIEAGGASEPLVPRQHDWTPDPSAELEDLFVPKCKGEQLSLLGNEQSKRKDRERLHQGNDFSPADWGSSADAAWQAERESGEALMTVDWPDVTAAVRRHSTAVRAGSSGGSDWKRTAAEWGGFARSAMNSRKQGGSEARDPHQTESSAWSFGALSLSRKWQRETEARTQKHSKDQSEGRREEQRAPIAPRPDAARLKDAALRSRGSIPEQTPDSEERRTKLREMLSLAKARVGEEFEEQFARAGSSASKAQESQQKEEQVQKRAEEKARKRARKQQRLIRDITFRKKREIGRLPTTDLMSRAPISCIASVPVLLLVLVTLAATQLEQFPSSVQQLLRVDAESLPRLPPPGLGIVDLTSAVITLDSGHRALEIRGELLNATTEQFHEIMLLASVFNAANEKTKSLVVNPQNELQGAQVVALDEEAIDRLQSRQVADTREVPPNARVPFRIVFPSYDSTDKWFSTSVYSVERSSGDA